MAGIHAADISPESPASEHDGVARRFALLGSGEALARCAAFGTMALLAHRVSAEGFGIIAFATAVVLYLSRIADAGIDLGVGVREVASSRHRLGEIVPAVLALRLVLAMGLVATFGLGALLWNKPEGRILALYTLTLLPLAGGVRWVLTGLERTAVVGAARTTGEIATLCAVALSVHGVEDLWRVPVAQLAGDSLAMLILWSRIRRLGVPLRPRWNGEVVRRLRHHMAPFVGSTLLGLVIYNSDLLFLRFLRDSAAVGYYAAAYALVSFLINVSSMYFLTLLPALSRLNAEPETQRALYADSVAHVLAVVLPVAVGGAIVSDAVVRLAFGEAFAPSGPVLGLLMMSVPLFALRDVTSGAILSRGREDVVFRISSAAAALNVVLNVLFIAPYGMFGAVAATLLTELLRLLMCVGAAHSLGYPWPPLVRAWRPLVAAIAMGGTLLALPTRAVWITIPLGAAVYVAALVCVRGVKRGSGGLPSLDV